MYSWFFLAQFDIKVLRYAELSDFFLASLKEPFTWVLAVLALVVVLSDNATSRRAQSAKLPAFLRWYGSKRYRQVNYLVAGFLVIAFMWFLATLNAEEIREGGGDTFVVKLSDDSPPKRRVLLGTTVKYLFLFDRSSGQIEMHPHENVLTLTRNHAVADKQSSTPSAQEN